MTLPASAARHQPSVYLSANPLFAGIGAGALGALDAGATWMLLAGGETLFQQGDAPDSLFVLVRGTLQVLVQTGGATRTVDYLGPGALVGELGVLLGEPRTATLRAVRDAELLQVPRDLFVRLLEAEPALGAALSRLLGQRLKRTTSQARVRPRVKTVTLLPVDGRPVPPDVVTSFLAALARSGVTSCEISSATIERESGAGAADVNRGEAGDGRILELCDRLERDHDLVVYEGDPDLNAWSERCLRQADLVLMIRSTATAGATTRPQAPSALERRAAAGRSAGSIELVLLHANDRSPSGTESWLHDRTVGGHHHVYLGRPDSYDRLARLVTGTALGLVLSGGGARGFAHIGVLRALRDAGIAVDVIGGSSMGAIIAAQYAAGFSIEDMIELNRRSFSGSDLSDLTVPTIALRRAGGTVRRLSAMFGDRQIEDLPLRYFCTTSDLTHAVVQVHDRGPLWLWTRASCAIPGLVPPIPSEGRLLVDGGLLSNLPVDAMRQRCSGIVVAVNVTPTVDLTTDAPLVATMSGWPHLWRMLRPGTARPFPNIAQLLSRTVFVNSVKDAEEQANQSDIYLEPPLGGIGMGDFAAIDQIVAAGYQHAAASIPAWRTTTAKSRSS